jgi:hypothetical protein
VLEGTASDKVGNGAKVEISSEEDMVVEVEQVRLLSNPPVRPGLGQSVSLVARFQISQYLLLFQLYPLHAPLSLDCPWALFSRP